MEGVINSSALVEALARERVLQKCQARLGAEREADSAESSVVRLSRAQDGARKALTRMQETQTIPLTSRALEGLVDLRA